MSIADKQIEDQIIGATRITVTFTDAAPDFLTLYDQLGGKWIKPAFCNPKVIPDDLFNELVEQFAGEAAKQFNTDPEIIRSWMRYDDFYDRYYNNI